MLPHCKEKREIHARYKSYEVRLYTSINDAEQEWSTHCPTDEYWEAEYHKALEDAPPGGLHPLYVTVWKEDEWIGLAYFQYKRINLSSSIKSDEETGGLLSRVKGAALSLLDMYTLVLGNMLVTGKYGCHFSKQFPLEDRSDMVLWLTDWVSGWLQKKGIKIGPVLIKDFNYGQRFHFAESKKVTEFCVQPNMILTIPEEWKRVEDYQEALKSKARIRYRRARNMVGDLTSRSLQADELMAYADEMHRQYRNIAENAGFNLFILDRDYFYQLKVKMKEGVLIKGYFNQEGRLVGFSTVLKNYDHLDAHFLGYELDVNKEKQLYLNMLFDMIEEGIKQKVKKIFMSRTAVEIKSSVGAKAVDVYCYLFHRKSIYNRLVPELVKRLYKPEEWVPRNPFRDQEGG